MGNFFLGFDDDCTYTCPNGKKPKRRKNHKPSFNGCGAYGIEIGMENMPGGMTRCCNTHDLCYDTCNNKRHNCDKEFKECLSDVCHRLKTKKGTKECLSTVDLMQAGTSVFGCQAYLDSQKKACRIVRGQHELKSAAESTIGRTASAARRDGPLHCVEMAAM
ncbi:Group XIIA secretory phospholipase A2 [Lamellibrachia satsuma]|nr:Group XIIA secretory phospholipase A2 [Lamellibrachia satsuma]